MEGCNGLRAWETPLQADMAGGRILGSTSRDWDEEKVISILPMNKQLIRNPDGHYLIFLKPFNGRIKQRINGRIRQDKSEWKICNKIRGRRLLIHLYLNRNGKDHVVLVSAKMMN